MWGSLDCQTEFHSIILYLISPSHPVQFNGYAFACPYFQHPSLKYRHGLGLLGDKRALALPPSSLHLDLEQSTTVGLSVTGMQQAAAGSKGHLRQGESFQFPGSLASGLYEWQARFSNSISESPHRGHRLTLPPRRKVGFLFFPFPVFPLTFPHGNMTFF